MPTEKKAKIIDNLQAVFSRSNAGVMTDYRGLTTADVTALRRKLRVAGVEFKVVKNTQPALVIYSLLHFLRRGD